MFSSLKHKLVLVAASQLYSSVEAEQVLMRELSGDQGQDAEQKPIFGTGNEPHLWNYAQAGKDWNNFDLCQNGEQQSPIDLSPSFARKSEDMMMQGSGWVNYKKAELRMHDGSPCFPAGKQGTLQLTLGDGQEAEYVVRHVLFKSPSDHCFDKVRMDVEMQIWLMRPDETTVAAALSLFWDRSMNSAKAKSCPFIQNIHPDFMFENAAAGPTCPNSNDDGPVKTTVYDVNLKSILGGFDMREFYSYEGSMTNPPCTEGIQWTIVRQPRPISDAQVEAFRSQILEDPRYKDGFNVRKPQALNNRTVYHRTGGATQLSTAAALVSATIAVLIMTSF